MSMVTLSWIVHTGYLFQEPQQNITNPYLTCQIKFKAPPWRQERQSHSRSQPHFHRHHSSSHHNSYRGHSRSQHWDNHSHHRSSSWWSCSTYRGYIYQSHCNTPHWQHCRWSMHRSSVVYHSRDHSRSHSWPSYKSSRWDGCTQIKFTFQQIMRQATPQEEPKGEKQRSTHGLLQFWWTF